MNTPQVFRVDVAFYNERTNRRTYGFTMKVEAADRDEAGRVAVTKALANDAEKTARDNAEKVRLGRPDLQFSPWTDARVEKVRRFARDNA